MPADLPAAVSVGPSHIHGTGVFARRPFAPGETVLVIDDSRVLDAAHPLRPELGEFDFHCDYLAGGKVVLMPSPERHINHACDPNTYVKTRAGVRHVLALRPIAAGEEITYDYLINCHGGAVWQCHCGAARCRGTIASSFFDLPLDLQREYLPLLDDWFVEEHAEWVARLREHGPDGPGDGPGAPAPGYPHSASLRGTGQQCPLKRACGRVEAHWGRG